jgi:SHS2 domain-containing protein
MTGPVNANGPVRFVEVEHTADRAVTIHGRSWQDLLVNAVHGMNSLMTATLPGGPRNIEKAVELEAFDAESLLVAWLSELAYWAEVASQVFDQFTFHELTDTHLKSTAKGVTLERLERHIKAVTYHDLTIVESSEGLSATVVFDV